MEPYRKAGRPEVTRDAGYQFMQGTSVYQFGHLGKKKVRRKIAPHFGFKQRLK